MTFQCVCISFFKMIFKEMIKKGQLRGIAGSGLRRMVKPYINQNTYLNVIFCLSPAFQNCASTEATLKFAAQACQLKTKPAQAQKKVTTVFLCLFFPSLFFFAADMN